MARTRPGGPPPGLPDRGATTPERRSARACLGYGGRHREIGSLFSALLATGDTMSYLMWSGLAAARAGDRATALRAQRRFLQWPSDSPLTRGDALLFAGNIAAILGDQQRTMELFREARRARHSAHVDFHQDADFAALRGTPAFEEFMRPRK